jgi:hypothetical protein
MTRQFARCLAVLALALGGPGPSTLAGPHDLISGTPIFEYHDFVWVNLHHYLYNEAFPTHHGNGQEIPGMTPAESAAVDSAIAFYRERYKGRDLLFDTDLLATTELLVLAGNASTLPPSAMADDLRAQLSAVYPIYRRHLWRLQAAQNDRWIADNQQLMGRYGPSIQRKLETVLRRKFSDGPYQEFVVNEANWAGGYTANREDVHTYPQTFISSGRPDYSGLKGLEMVFHESLHAGPFSQVQEALDQEFARHNVQDKLSLWHFVLFYSAGEATREVLARDGIVYQPYAYAPDGPFTRGLGARVEPIVRKYWQPYMDGGISMQQAIVSLVDAAVAQAGSGSK